MKNDSTAAHPATSLVKVDVCGTPIEACRENDTIWISVRRVCDVLGLAPNKQIERLRRKEWATGTVMVSVADDGKSREVYCLSHRSFPMWLATIEPSRSTSPRLAGLLARFQKEAADALQRHFFGERQDSQMASLLARLVDTVEHLQARVDAYDARPVLTNRPSLGPGGARVHALDPLKEIARIEAHAVGKTDKKSIASMRKVAEDELRERVDFRRTGGQAWAAFPQARIGDLHCAMLRLLHNARKRAAIAQPASVQLSLVANANAKRSAS